MGIWVIYTSNQIVFNNGYVDNKANVGHGYGFGFGTGSKCFYLFFIPSKFSKGIGCGYGHSDSSCDFETIINVR